ncbi:C2H2-type zinc finger protein [Natrinema sp. H-ect1]|uniref:C2H2-type zinc finger protein n=1 Tax=Natrinema sp. H-ect1 TaxID=3242700 RepID=UPI00359CD03B
MYQASEEDDSSILICRGDGPNLVCTDEFYTLVETLPDRCVVPTSILKLGVLSRHLVPEPDQFELNPENVNIESTSTAVVPPRTLSRVRWLLSNHTDHLNDNERKKIGELCTVSELNIPPEMGEFDTEAIRSESQSDIDESLFRKKRSRNFECEHCGVEYESTAALNGHLANCDERQTEKRTKRSFKKKKYSCEHCDETFRKKVGLRVHKKRNCDGHQTEKQTKQNSKKKEYRCEYCDESFRKKVGLRVHKKRNCDKKQSSKSTSNQRPAFGKEIRKDKGSERVSGRNPFANPNKIKDTGLHQGGN